MIHSSVNPVYNLLVNLSEKCKFTWDYLNDISHCHTVDQLRVDLWLQNRLQSSNFAQLHWADIFQLATESAKRGSLAPNNEDT